MVFLLPYYQVGCGGEHCPFHVKAMFFPMYFSFSPEHFAKDWRIKPWLDAVAFFLNKRLDGEPNVSP